MDLGFGKENQVVGDAVSKALLASTQQQEAMLDQELASYDRLLHDQEGGEAEAALEQVRARRLQQLKHRHKQVQQWKQQGHGVYSDLVDSTNVSTDVAKTFFQTTKESSQVVLHFYRPTTTICDVFHKHLSKLAPRHLETKFVKLNVDGCDHGRSGNGASFLVEKLGIVILPTLVLIKDNRVIHHMHGFDELGGEPDGVSTKTLAYVLSTHGILDAHDDEVPYGDDDDDENGNNNKKSKNKSAIRNVTKYGKSIRQGMYNDDYDSE